MNKMRNEMEIVLAGVKILLRPTFENMANMEAKLGGLSYLVWKFCNSGNSVESKARVLPPLTECAQIIFFNQAETKADRPSEKLYSLDEIWEMVQSEGIKIVTPVAKFLGQVAAGNAAAPVLSEDEVKKSTETIPGEK